MSLVTTTICPPAAWRLVLALLLATVAARTVRAQGTDVAAPQTQVYALGHVDAEIARSQLLTALGDSASRARIVADRATNRLIVIAPPEVQTLVAQVVAELDKAAETSDTPRPSETLPLRSLTAEQLLARLQQALPGRVVARRGETGDWLGFDVDPRSPSAITIWANKKTKQVRFAGPANQTRAWRKVIQALDAPPNSQVATRLLATGAQAAGKIRQAVDVLDAAGHVAQTVQTEVRPPAGEADEETGGRPLGPVQIERVADTDLLLIEGDPEDVRRVLEVIEEIERLARTSEPAVEIVALEHVDSTALATIIQQVFTQSLNRYGYGRLVALPLVKPNAVLLVGLPTTVKKAQEILKQLDRPGKASAQFETFRLEHARAEDARQIVENLFADQTGETASELPSLSPKAQVIADTRTNALIVRAAPRDMDEVRELVKQIDRVGSESVNELRIFKLKSSIAEDVEDLLQDALDANQDNDAALSRLLRLVTIDEEGRRQLESGMLADVTAYASPSANALVVIAPTESMPIIAALIEQVDQAPDAAVDLKIIPVENGDAVALAEMLGQLFGTDDEADNQGGPGTSGIAGLRVEVDERTNSVVVAGTREDLITVEAILRTLDSADARQRQNRVYRLKNKPVEDIAFALNEWLRAEREVQGTAPGTVSPFQQIEREVVVVPELGSNSLIVSATPRYYDEIANVIEQLDALDPMVMVQVLIAEIELGELDEFGVELGLQDSLLFDRGLLGDLLTTTNTTITNDAAGGSTQFQQDIIQSATITPGFDFGNASNGLGNSGSDTSLATASNLAGQALSSFGVNRVSTAGGFGGFVLSASSDSVSMLLRALQESQRLEVLNRPQIMTLDNQPGFAFVGQTVPFITSSTPNAITGQPTNNIERIDVGLSLQVTPRISPDGLIVMTVDAANNRLRPLADGVPVAISPNGAPINSPIVDSIQASTTISAVSGQTVVLSGLITKEDNATHRRVPLLSDIPLLGDLFKFDSVSTVRRELIIILTPHIINNRFEAEMLKQVESSRMHWCLSDVIDLHGPVGLRSHSDRAGAAEAEVVYPDQMPTPEMLPTPVEPTPVGPPQAALPVEAETAKPGWFRLPKFTGKSDEATTSIQ